MTETIAPNTYVVTPGGLAVVVRANRRHRTDGYDLLTGGAYTNFYDARTVRTAVVGENVCEHPRGHGCGLLHVSDRERAAMPRKAATIEDLGLTEIGPGMWRHTSGWTVSLNGAGTMLTAEAPAPSDLAFDVMRTRCPLTDELARIVRTIEEGQ